MAWYDTPGHDTLFPTHEVTGATHPLIEIDPDSVTIARCSIGRMVRLQAAGSHAVWRPAPGRKTAYTVNHDGRHIGLMFLSSPVINLGARDAHLGLPTEGRGDALREVADLSVCVGLQPLAWHWNIGKLVAMLATSDFVADQHEARYGDTLRWITTTSLYGKGSQYNRIYKFVGYTKGYGHQHIDDERYTAMLGWMRAHDVPVPSSRFGDGSNPRMRRIAAYQRASGEKVNLQHGNIRGVYVAPARQGSVTDVIHRWHDRWGRPRYERTRDLRPPYHSGIETAPRRAEP